VQDQIKAKQQELQQLQQQLAQIKWDSLNSQMQT
jgi:hypothetical protein